MGFCLTIPLFVVPSFTLRGHGTRKIDDSEPDRDLDSEPEVVPGIACQKGQVREEPQYRIATVKMSRANRHDTSTMQLQDKKKIRGFLTILLRKSSLQRLTAVRAQLHTSTFRKLAFTEALQRNF